jgi:adenylate cyclase
MSKRIPIIIGLIILALSVWVQLTSFSPIRATFARLENIVYDLQLRTKLFAHRKFSESPVVIVDIDDTSLSKEGRWPWPRSKLADLVYHLHQQGVVVIAFDVLFPEKQTNIIDSILNQLKKESLTGSDITKALQELHPYFDEDAKFAKSLTTIDTALGMTFFPKNITQGKLSAPLLTLNTPAEKQLGFILAPGYIADIPELESAAKNSGFLNVFPDADGIVRRVPLLMRYQDGLYPSLALNAVRLYLLSNIKLITAPYGDDSIRLEGIELGDHTIPTDTQAQVVIPFVGNSYTLPYISATDVLHDNTPTNALQGKIVFVGTSATGLGDLHATAVQGVYPGVEIQASIAYGILMNTFSYKPAWAIGAEILITVVLGLLFIFTFPYLGPRTLGLLIIIIPIILIMLNNIVWEKTGLIITILIPLILPVILAIVNILYGYLFETLRREHLKEMFGQYVPEKHIDEMLKASGKNYGLLGEDREMTVLFADIRNFTTISEPLAAAQLKDLLNDFLTPMAEIIFKYHGTIDKYVGDLIMAFWGAPLKDKKHAQHAIAAALDMQTMVKKLHSEFKARNLPEINIGIGLNSGIMSVGDMGSKFRRNYTVLGDAVNLASRIESLTKYYGVKIMVTESTQQEQKNFVFRQLDKVRVKGKKTGIAIYEVVCKQNELTDVLRQELELSHQALELYFKQQWKQAHALFSQLQKEHPNTLFYQIYLNRIIAFEVTPPPANWDGVYVHTSK